MTTPFASGRNLGSYQLVRALGNLDSIRVWEAFGPTASGTGLVRLLIRRDSAGGGLR